MEVFKVSEEFDGQVAARLLKAISEAVGVTFVTMCVVRPGGQELASLTTMAEEGYNPCWQTTMRLALGATGGTDVFDVTREFLVDHPRENVESPRLAGVGLRLFRGAQVVATIGLLGLSVAEAIVVIAEAARKEGFTIAERQA